MPDHKCSDPICQRLDARIPDVIEGLFKRKAGAREAVATLKVSIEEVLIEFSKEELVRYTADIITRRALADARRTAQRDSVIGQIVESLADEMERRGQHKRF